MQHIIPLAAEEIERKILNIPDHWGEVAEDTFDPESTHAQSGLAVAQAIANTVQFTEQELNVTQQTQARVNIGAAASEELISLSDQLSTKIDRSEIATDEEIIAMLAQDDVLPAVADVDGSILADENENILLW
jgi:hypothetical protein